MLINEHKTRHIVAKIKPEEERRIKDFIQGAIYCFCNNFPDRYFKVRDLFGKKNTVWVGTPLQVLYDWHNGIHKNDPHGMTGMDLGWLVLKVITDDKRLFEIKEGYTHEYICK